MQRLQPKGKVIRLKAKTYERLKEYKLKGETWDRALTKLFNNYEKMQEEYNGDLE